MEKWVDGPQSRRASALPAVCRKVRMRSKHDRRMFFGGCKSSREVGGVFVNKSDASGRRRGSSRCVIVSISVSTTIVDGGAISDGLSILKRWKFMYFCIWCRFYVCVLADDWI